MSGPTIPVPRRALVEMFARAASATCLTGYLGEQRATTAPTVEKLAAHITAIYEALSEILGAAHLTLEPSPAGEARAPEVDPSAAADELRLLIGRADALADVTHEHFPRVVVRTEGADGRGFRRIAHLVELTADAVADASDATDRLIAALEQSSPREEP